MSKHLVIAEKPSVAADIAKALGGFVKHEDYFENDQYVITSAVGHLLELICPPDYEVKRGKWSLTNLPVIPAHFDLSPIEKSANRLKVIIKLAKRRDISGFINACDAGREGELIFYYIYRYSGSKLPVLRLWLQSMTKESICQGFKVLKDSTEMAGLTAAALCRSESDWLVGINGTRAMTAFNSKTGGFHLTTVGRVQTPTLSIVVNREIAIKKFVSKPYWEVEANFAARNGHYNGTWIDHNFVDQQIEFARPDRIWSLDIAQQIYNDCLNKTGEVTETAKIETRLSPALFDLTSLQREANQRFGFSAKSTLNIAQSLYERHKVLTYPRTDSRFLPEDYVTHVQDIFGLFAQIEESPYKDFSTKIISNKWVVPNKKIFNNAKISDHFAIIPTQQLPKSLNEQESKIYDLVVRRFHAVFFPAAQFLATLRTTIVNTHHFKSEGKVLKSPGWLEIYGKDVVMDKQNLVAVDDHEIVGVDDLAINALETKPPARFNEATLLSAMEGAGKLVDDEELQQAMAGRGLGTPATRAQIIENLIGEQYLTRDQRMLIPTAKAFSLHTLLHGLGVTELLSPELTGDWEWKLARIERGEFSRPQFMSEIEEMTRHIVVQAKQHESDSVPGDYAQLKHPCPKCGGFIKENYKKYQCQNCDYALWKTIASRQMEVDEIEALLKEQKIGPLSGFRSKLGRLFTASLIFNEDFQPQFDFELNSSLNEDIDFSSSTSLGLCPICHSNVYVYKNQYVCQGAVGATKTCTFKVSNVILQQAITEEQISKLLKDRKTDLLKSFISTRSRRKFSAFLILDEKNSIGFEFEAKSKAAKNSKTTKAATFTKTTTQSKAEDKLDNSSENDIVGGDADVKSSAKAKRGSKTAADSSDSPKPKTAADQPKSEKRPTRARTAATTQARNSTTSTRKRSQSDGQPVIETVPEAMIQDID